LFVFCIAIWFVSFLFPLDYSFYQSLNLPSFAPPVAFFSIAWTITYLFIGISMYLNLSTYSFSELPNSYKISLVVNYLFNQSFVLLFFGLKNTFFGFAACMGMFLSLLFLYQESMALHEKSAIALRPYVLLSVFATVLSLSIYLLNL
ncbi:MAG: tryptophan-rich sensory protein, partial [Bacilli bacterium]|nr:tryptophan-rich sensory protein [Bacilli bacterium]